VNRERVLVPGPWLKTAGWRGGSWLVGLMVLLIFLDLITGDLVDIGWRRPTLLMFLGFLMSVPYGWAWVKGRAPLPPKPAVLVPQAAIQGHGESGSTYVFVGPTGGARPGLGRRTRDLGPIAWFLYTVFWRWPLLVGDAILTVVWRGIDKVFGFNGGPRASDFDPSQVDEFANPERLKQPDRDTF
jgi:hypothetical protein